MIESIVYGAGIGAYAAGVRIASVRHHKARLMTAGQRDTWRRLAAMPHDRPWVWVHAASLGEFEQGRPIIERIRQRNPELRILLTFFSPSGYEVRKNYDGADLVCYLPFDTARNARRFLSLVRPQTAIFVKYEIWRNYLRELHRAHIPTYLISAAFRPGQAFFRSYGGPYRRWLHFFDRIFVQDEQSRRLLAGIGIDDAMVAGDTRFDRVTDIMQTRRELPEIERFAERMRADGRTMLVVGSSWAPDEAAYTPWLQKRTDVASIIAPHEFDERRLRLLCEPFGDEAILYSELLKHPERAHEVRIVVIDCFGLLSTLYRYADVAYVGGGFGVGIHNINEAAVYGVPVVFGPNYHRFIEAEEMIACEGGISYDSPAQFAPIADRLADDTAERHRRGEAAGAYIRSKLGASDRIYPYLHLG